MTVLRSRGRGKFTFTSFGDQGTPTLGKKSGSTSGSLQWVNDNLGSPAAGDMPAGVERVQPLFHLFNGDLCYANISENRVRTWTDLEPTLIGRVEELIDFVTQPAS